MNSHISLAIKSTFFAWLLGVYLPVTAEEHKFSLAKEFAPLEPYVKWLPENTETLLGAKGFTAKLDATNLMPHLSSMTLGSILVLEDGKVWEPLADNKISLALCGGRNFETVSSFGGHRSEGCCIIFFEKELAESGETWLKKVRPRAKEIRKIGGRDVLVFPSAVAMEPAFKLKPWQGTFVVLLNSRTLLYATSDAYLQEVFERIDKPALDRALPDTLPEWKSVDPASVAWMIRHVPKNQPARELEGIVWNQYQKESKVTYYPAPGKQPVIEEYARTRWIRDTLSKEPAKIERAPGDLVTMSISTEGANEAWGFLLSLQHYVLQGDSGP